jgi:hypothetical protein
VATANKFEEKYLHLDKEIARRRESFVKLNFFGMFCYPV